MEVVSQPEAPLPMETEAPLPMETEAPIQIETAPMPDVAVPMPDVAVPMPDVAVPQQAPMPIQVEPQVPIQVAAPMDIELPPEPMPAPMPVPPAPPAPAPVPPAPVPVPSSQQHVTDKAFRRIFGINDTNVVRVLPFPNSVAPALDFTLNAIYASSSNPLARLHIDDTFHDFAKDRTGYSSIHFNNEGIANYLMNDDYSMQDNVITDYKDNLNYQPAYKEGKGAFEIKVTGAFEQHYKLQPANMSITYDEIIAGFTFNLTNNRITLTKGLNDKINLSNGSTDLIIGGDETMSLSQRFSEEQNEYVLIYQQNMLKIANFIKWYLHGSRAGQVMDDASITFALTPEIRILFDGTLGHMPQIFSQPNSGGTPYIAVPSILDSAATSSKLFDPQMDIDYEVLPVTLLGDPQIVPIVSNYFSYNEIFMCYLANNGRIFGEEGRIHGFSFIMFRIYKSEAEFLEKHGGPVENLTYATLNAAIKYIREFGGNITSDDAYKGHIKTITDYINLYSNRGVIVRYYLGEVEKQNASDDTPCGTCGAGVPYLGKVFKSIQEIIREVQPYPYQENYSDATGRLKALFNGLKTTEKLNSRMPIADARILKLFSDVNGNITISSKDDLLLLFKIITDYKRCGDYQQVYAVLYKIMSNGSNTGNHTFSTGDELAALLARLAQVPTIYQVSNTGRTTLYRAELYKMSAEEMQRRNEEGERRIIQEKIEFLHKQIEQDLYAINRVKSLYTGQFLPSFTEIYEKLKESYTNYPADKSYPEKIVLLNAILQLQGLQQLYGDAYAAASSEFDALSTLERDTLALGPAALDPAALQSAFQSSEETYNKIRSSIAPIQQFTDFIRNNFPSLEQLLLEEDVARQTELLQQFSKDIRDDLENPLLNLHFKPDIKSGKLLVVPAKYKIKDLVTHLNKVAPIPAAITGRPQRTGKDDMEKIRINKANEIIIQQFTNFLKNMSMLDIDISKVSFDSVEQIKTVFETIIANNPITLVPAQAPAEQAQAPAEQAQAPEEAMISGGGKTKMRTGDIKIGTTKANDSKRATLEKKAVKSKTLKSKLQTILANKTKSVLVKPNAEFLKAEKRQMYTDILQVVFRLFEKCNVYKIDLFALNDLPDTITEIITNLNERVDVNQFIYRLLFTSYADLEENDEDDVGIMYSLREIAENTTRDYTISQMFIDLNLNMLGIYLKQLCQHDEINNTLYERFRTNNLFANAQGVMMGGMPTPTKRPRSDEENTAFSANKKRRTDTEYNNAETLRLVLSLGINNELINYFKTDKRTGVNMGGNISGEYILETIVRVEKSLGFSRFSAFYNETPISLLKGARILQYIEAIRGLLNGDTDAEIKLGYKPYTNKGYFLRNNAMGKSMTKRTKRTKRGRTKRGGSGSGKQTRKKIKKRENKGMKHTRRNQANTKICNNRTKKTYN
jgi:hypothetical protein